jgi:hypothetical protein
MEQQLKYQNFLIKNESVFDNFYNEYSYTQINNVLLIIDENKLKLDEIKNDFEFLKNIIDETNLMITHLRNSNELIYTRTGYYRLNDNIKSSGYSGATRATKSIFENKMNKCDLDRINHIINKYFDKQYNIYKDHCAFQDGKFRINYNMSFTNLFRNNKIYLLFKKFIKLKFFGKI